VLQRRLTCWLANFSTDLDYRLIFLHRLNREQRFNRETEIIIMFQPFVLFGSTALIALVSATPAAPACGQGLPAGLLTLDLPQPSSDGVQLTDDQRSKARGAYARSRKTRAHSR